MSDRNRVSLYLPDQSLQSLKRQARLRGMSLSAYLAALGQQQETPIKVNERILALLSLFNARALSLADNLPLELRTGLTEIVGESRTIMKDIAAEKEKAIDLFESQS